MKKIFNLLFFLIALSLSSVANASGTGVGNGGDPLFEFMEATRVSLIETVKLIVNDPQERKNFCSTLRGTSEQLQFCREFFLVVSSDLLRLNQGDHKTAFVLREKPLLVQGPDGKEMMVAARTSLGPEGVIELHRDSVKNFSPSQVLFILAHEFQHKSNFGGKYIGDNEQIGPYAYARDLIDTVAISIAGVAKRRGKIGSQFGIRDIFECKIDNSGAQFGARISSPRFFLSEDLLSYQTSVGRNAADGYIYLPEGINSSIQFQFLINEPNNCSAESPSRMTRVNINRVTQLNDGSVASETLASRDIAGNPMCPNEEFALDLAWKQNKFSCRYYGSEGTTAFQKKEPVTNRP